MLKGPLGLAWAWAKAWGMYGWTDGRTDRNSPLCSTEHCPLWVRYPNLLFRWMDTPSNGDARTLILTSCLLVPCHMTCKALRLSVGWSVALWVQSVQIDALGEEITHLLARSLRSAPFRCAPFLSASFRPTPFHCAPLRSRARLRVGNWRCTNEITCVDSRRFNP